MEPRQYSSEPLKAPSVPVPDLDIDDLLRGSALPEAATKISDPSFDSSVMLPPARCFKGRLLADQDIFSSNGKHLVRVGQVLDADSAELLAKKQMQENPLVLHLRQCELDSKQLFSDFQKLSKKVEGLDHFVDLEGGISPWQKMLTEILPICDDGLVYLAHVRDHCVESYEQSLFCSWLGGQLALSLGLSREKVKYSVMSGLFHLVGRLHLPESLRFLAENNCESEAWNDFQHHVIYGKLLIQQAGDASLLTVTEIIAQQGEYANSLGYPFSLTKDGLHQESMLLSLSRDLFQLLFIDGGSLADSLLFLQLHEARFGQAASWAMQKKVKTFLRTQGPESYSDCSYSEQMADYLIETSIVLAQLHAAVSLIVRPVTLGLAKSDKQYLAIHLVNLLKQIEDYKNNSGIADIEFVAGIDSMQYEDAHLLDGEIYQIIQRQRGLLALFFEVIVLLDSVLESIRGQAKPEVLSEVTDLHGLIRDVLEPFKNRAR